MQHKSGLATDTAPTPTPSPTAIAASHCHCHGHSHSTTTATATATATVTATATPTATASATATATKPANCSRRITTGQPVEGPAISDPNISLVLQPRLHRLRVAHGSAVKLALRLIESHSFLHSVVTQARKFAGVKHEPARFHSGVRCSLAKQLALLLSVRVPVFPHGGGVRTLCSLGEIADGTGLFMFHSMFMDGTVRRADLWFLEYSVFTRTRFEHVCSYTCSPPMQPHHAT